MAVVMNDPTLSARSYDTNNFAIKQYCWKLLEPVNK